MPFRLREATKEDMPAIGRVAARAFHPSTDPMSAALFPPHLRSKETPDADEAEAWRRARKALAMDVERTVMIVAVDDERAGEIAGFAYWEEPLADGQGEKEQVGRTEMDGVSVSGLDREVFKTMKKIVEEASDAVLGKGGVARTWHLEYLSVDPTYQRRGLGKMLLEWGTARADAEKKDCYMFATAAGKPLYEVAGFEVGKEVMLFGSPHYAMVRKPQ